VRLDLNLASRPYENVRDFYVRWGSLLALTLAATALLVGFAVHGFIRSRDVNREIAEKRAETARLREEAQRSQAILDQPANRVIRDRAVFVNDLIAHKAFSWTQAFTDLEKIMPPRIHVVSIRPELDADNQLEIRMVLAGDSRDRALELLRRMEESRTFRQPELQSENDAGGEMQFQIAALYVPRVVQETRPQEERQ
jgi:type IV pilus assembly protein PilN